MERYKGIFDFVQIQCNYLAFPVRPAATAVTDAPWRRIEGLPEEKRPGAK